MYTKSYKFCSTYNSHRGFARKLQTYTCGLANQFINALSPSKVSNTRVLPVDDATVEDDSKHWVME